MRQPPRRILLIKPSSLGDIVHALPVLAALRRTWPDAHIAWLVGSGFAALLAGHPLLDEVIPFDRERFGRMWRSPAIFIEFWRFVGAMRRKRFDLVIDLQGLIRSGILAFCGGARTRVGFADAREGAWLFYNQRVRYPLEAEHAVEKNLHVARSLGLQVDPIDFPLPVSADDQRDADTLLAAAGLATEGYTAVVVGARWASKLWPASRFAELIDRIHAEGGPRCVLVGAPSDRDLAAKIAAACRAELRPVDLVGRTNLRLLVALLARAEQVVCLDSGPMHIAAALNRPLAAIFGPTNPARTGPYSPAARVVRLPLPCSPCYRRECPLSHHDCLQKLSADEVYEQVRKLAADAETAHE